MLTHLILTLALGQAAVAADSSHVTGRVIEQGTANGLSGCRVTLMRVPQGPSNGPMMPQQYVATTGDDGRFTFDALDAGRYTLRTEKAGFAEASGNSSGMPGTLSFELTPGASMINVQMVMVRAAVITGRVVGPGGEPMVNARVMVLRKGPTPPPNVPASVNIPRLVPVNVTSQMNQTNDLGEFRLFGLPPGEYAVQAAPPMTSPYSQVASTEPVSPVATYYPDVIDAASAKFVAVTAGSTVTNLTIRMAVAPHYRVSGQVVDERGRAVANAMVRLMPGGRMEFMTGPPPMTRTDANGRFSLSGVLASTYTLTAIPPSPASGGGPTTPASGVVSLSSINGVGTQFSDSDSARAPVVVAGDVSDLRVVVRAISQP